MGSHWAAVAQEPGRGAKDRRPAGHQRHRPRSEDRLPVAGLPGRLRAFNDGLQSLSPLDDARDLASVVAIEFAGAAGRDDERVAQEYRQAQGFSSVRCFGRMAKRPAERRAGRGGEKVGVRATAIIDLEGVTRVAALETTRGVRVNVVSPSG
jgi:hypothetical protein